MISNLPNLPDWRERPPTAWIVAWFSFDIASVGWRIKHVGVSSDVSPGVFLRGKRAERTVTLLGVSAPTFDEASTYAGLVLQGLGPHAYTMAVSRAREADPPWDVPL